MECIQVIVSWMAKQFSKAEILRHVMTHEIHHIGKLLSVCRNPSCSSELFQ
ncbi:DinB family protein [Bacillus atrophaeus]|uniref:DinB family protein n=1 Tax=Bacillus atrophaeus TaxID=1452 RepID=UPI00399092B7